jgi:hypothetical protein
MVETKANELPARCQKIGLNIHQLRAQLSTEPLRRLGDGDKPATCLRISSEKLLGWPKRCKLAHAFL